MSSPFVPHRETPTLLHSSSTPSLLPTFRPVDSSASPSASPFVPSSAGSINNASGAVAQGSVFVVSTKMLPDVPFVSKAQDNSTNTLFGGGNSGRSGSFSSGANNPASAGAGGGVANSMNYAMLPSERPLLNYQPLPEEEVIPGYGRVPRGLEQRSSIDVDSVRGYGNLPRSASFTSSSPFTPRSGAAATSSAAATTTTTTAAALVPAGFVVSSFQPTMPAASSSSTSTSTSTSNVAPSPFVPRAMSLQIESSDGGVAKPNQYDKMKQIRNPYEFHPVAPTPGYDKMKQVKNPYGELKSDDELASQRTNYGALKDDEQLTKEASADDPNNPYRSLQPLPDLTDDVSQGRRSPYDAMPSDLAMKLQMAGGADRTSEVTDPNNPYRRLRPLPEPTDDELQQQQQLFASAATTTSAVVVDASSTTLLHRKPTAEELLEESELFIVIPNPIDEALRRQLPSPQSSPTISPPATRAAVSSSSSSSSSSQPIAVAPGRRGGGRGGARGGGGARGSPSNDELQRR
jgi:hypothetical protein